MDSNTLKELADAVCKLIHIAIDAYDEYEKSQSHEDKDGHGSSGSRQQARLQRHKGR